MRAFFHKSLMVLFSILLLLSCDNKPKIKEDKMSEIIFDIFLAESYSRLVVGDSAAKVAAPNMKDPDSLAMYYQEIFKRHHVTSDEFKESIDWYEAHPEIMDTVLTHVVQIVEDSNKKYNTDPQ